VNVAAVAGENGPLGEPARALVAGVRPRLLVLELYVIAQIPRHLSIQSCGCGSDQMDPDPKFCYRFGSGSKLTDSVPDPDSTDPHVFGPPGSGSTSQRYGSEYGSFYHHAKIVTNTLIPSIL
jgi:hypothetical protein